MCFGDEEEEEKVPEEETNEETDMAKAIAIALALFSMICAIVSYVFCQQAFDQLQNANSDYGDIITHWQSLPIQDIKLVATTANCPTGYEESVSNLKNNELFRRMDWEGTKNWCNSAPSGFQSPQTFYRCQCPSGTSSSYETGWKSDNTPCSATAMNSDNMCYPVSDVFIMNFKEHEGACNNTELNVGLRTDPSLNTVPLTNWRGKKICIKRGGVASMNRRKVSGSNSCGSGMVVCGVGGYEGGAVCADSVDLCPITDITELNWENAITSTATNQPDIVMESGANGHDTQGRLPIVEFWITMEDPCWEGTEGKDINRGTAGTRLNRQYNQGCDKVDTRFTFLDSDTESNYLTLNNVPTMGGMTLTATYAGSNPKTYNYPVIDFDDRTDVNFKISFRREIVWDENCPLGAKNDEVSGHESDVDLIEGYQKTLLILNLMFGMLFSICYFCFVCAHVMDYDADVSCIPGEGAEEQKNLDLCSSCVTTVAVCIRFIPLILCLLLSKKLSDFAADAQDSECSDDITNTIVQRTGTELEKVYDSNVNCLISDIFSLLMIFLPIIYRNCCGGGEEEEEDGKDGGEDEENVEMVEETPQDDGAYAEEPTGGPPPGAYGGPPAGGPPVAAYGQPQYNYGTPAPFEQ